MRRTSRPCPRGPSPGGEERISGLGLVLHGLVAQVAFQISQEDLDSARIGAGGRTRVVRRDDHVGQLPEGRVVSTDFTCAGVKTTSRTYGSNSMRLGASARMRVSLGRNSPMTFCEMSSAGCIDDMSVHLQTGLADQFALRLHLACEMLAQCLRWPGQRSATTALTRSGLARTHHPAFSASPSPRRRSKLDR